MVVWTAAQTASSSMPGGTPAIVHDSRAFKPLFMALLAIRSRRGPRRRRPVKARADKVYHSAERLAWLRGRGIVPRITRPGIDQKLAELST